MDANVKSNNGDAISWQARMLHQDSKQSIQYNSFSEKEASSAQQKILGFRHKRMLL